MALLTSGRYSAHLTADGSGAALVGEMAVTRWRPDPTQAGGGVYIFLRDVASGTSWSLTAAPRPPVGGWLQAVLIDYNAEFHCAAHGIEARVDVLAATDVTGEVRRVVLRNTGTEPRVVRGAAGMRLAHLVTATGPATGPPPPKPTGGHFSPRPEPAGCRRAGTRRRSQTAGRLHARPDLLGRQAASPRAAARGAGGEA